jgi:hypothetical protein
VNDFNPGFAPAAIDDRERAGHACRLRSVLARKLSLHGANQTYSNAFQK